MPELTTPTVLSFNRKLENSDALMFSGNWENSNKQDQWKPIELTARRNRGVIGNKLLADITDDPEAMQKEVEKPNPVWGDEATLPLNSEHDTLKVSFTLRVLGDLHIPSACNNPAYQEKISKAVLAYADKFEFKELATRYAYNIANGSFLWRNRVCAENIEIRVRSKSFEKEITFNAYDYPLNNFDNHDEKIKQLAEVIQQGLGGRERFVLVEVDTYVKLGAGQRVWPSQEMIMNVPKGEKSRTLFHLDGCAAMHSQKIGNALRAIDTWYDEGDNLSPIAIEPYGSVTHRGQAFRTSRNDFYSLRDRWFLRDETLTEEQQHFVMAILVRGGVFSEKGE